MNRTTAARIGAVIAAAGLVALAAPAYAEDPAAAFRIQDDSVFLQQDTDETTDESLIVLVNAEGAGTITDIVYTFDTTGLNGLVEFTAEKGGEACTQDGVVWTCTAAYPYDYEDGEQSIGFTPRFAVKPLAGANGKGSFTASVTGTGATSATATIPVTVAEGIAFDIGEMPEVSGEPGDVVSIPVTVTNIGDMPIYHPRLRVNLAGVDRSGPGFTNCLTGQTDLWASMECTFPVTLAPGQTYRLSAPLEFKIRQDALGPGQADSWVYWTTVRENKLTGPAGTGPALTIEGADAAPADAPEQTHFYDPDQEDNAAWEGPFIEITSENRGDVAAFSKPLAAKTGETTLTIGVRNNGPAALADIRSGSPVTEVWFDLPKGVELVELPKECYEHTPGEFGEETKNPPATYSCGTPVNDVFSVGEQYTFELKVNVKKVDLRQTGVVKVGYGFYSNPQPRYDADPSNSTADILFEGGTPNHGTDPGAGTGATPTPGTTTPGNNAGGKDNAGGSNGPLASTGFKIGTAAAIGLALAVAGVIVLRTTRRRAEAVAGAAEAPEASADE